MRGYGDWHLRILPSHIEILHAGSYLRWDRACLRMGLDGERALEKTQGVGGEGG